MTVKQIALVSISGLSKSLKYVEGRQCLFELFKISQLLSHHIHDVPISGQGLVKPVLVYENTIISYKNIIYINYYDYFYYTCIIC